jgi:hypothetical protein
LSRADRRIATTAKNEEHIMIEGSHRDPTNPLAAAIGPWKDTFGCDGGALHPPGDRRDKQIVEASRELDNDTDTLRDLGFAAIRRAVRMHREACAWEAEAWRRHNAGDPQRAYDEAPRNPDGSPTDRAVYEEGRRSENIAGLAVAGRIEAERILMAAILVHFDRIDCRGKLDAIGEGWEPVAVRVDGMLYVVSPDPNDDDESPDPQLSIVDAVNSFDDSGLDE